jgi:uncharacterized protein DUF4886
MRRPIVLIVVLVVLPLALFGTFRQVLNRSPDVHTLRILFVGNSYTYYNNLPRLIAGLAESADESWLLETDMIAEGGATLQKHWEDGKALDMLKRGHWDYVVLQEQSNLGPGPIVDGVIQINDPATFYRYARLFDAEIKKAGAKTIFYMTWARQDAPQNQAKLSSAYLAIAKELGAEVAPVGMAWQAALSQNPNLALYQQDGSHPTSTGSYLAACVFYATIYGKSPEGLTGRITQNVHFELVNLGESDARFLQRIAWEVVAKHNRRAAATKAM